MVCSDQRGPEVLESCRRADVVVPDEIAVVGVDNDEPLCDVANPPLSSVWPNHERVGFEAARVLARWMAGGAPPQIQRVSVRGLVTRSSSAALAIGDRVVAQAMQLIRDRACEGISVDEIARSVAVSRSVLQRRFRALLDRPVSDMLIAARLRRARELLGETDLPLAFIAERAGFRHQEYLGAVFKRQVGQTPGQYRREVRGRP